MSDIAEKVRGIYEITRELEETYPGRHFASGDYMVRGIDEVIAAMNVASSSSGPLIPLAIRGQGRPLRESRP